MFARRQSHPEPSLSQPDPVPGNWRYVDRLVTETACRRPEFSAYDHLGRLGAALGVDPDDGLPPIAVALWNIRGLQRSTALAFQVPVTDQGLAVTELPRETLITPFAVCKNGLCVNATLRRDGEIKTFDSSGGDQTQNVKVAGFNGTARLTDSGAYEVISQGHFNFAGQEGRESGTVRVVAARFAKTQYINLTDRDGLLPLDEEHRLLSHYRDSLFLAKTSHAESFFPRGRYGCGNRAAFELSARTDVYHVEGRMVAGPVWYRLMVTLPQGERFRVRIDPTGEVRSVKCYGGVPGVEAVGRHQSSAKGGTVLETQSGDGVVAMRNNIDLSCEAAFGHYKQIWQCSSLLRNHRLVEEHIRRNVERFFPGLLDKGLNIKAALTNIGDAEIPLIISTGNRATRDVRTPQIVRER